jgi:hypothetical protein
VGKKQHQDALKKHEKHKPGCIVRCETDYIEGEPCSHRWNAAEQARGEPSVYTVPLNNAWKIVNWGIKRLKALKGEGALLGAIGNDGQGRNVAFLKPFYRSFIPFPHNAHHIIPMSVLWTKVIDAAAERASPRSGEMKDLVIVGLLEEAYNHNDRPNMITLPLRTKESELLGLPKHLEDKALNHPVYSEKVAKFVSAKVPPKYSALASDVKAEKHLSGKTAPEVGAELRSISTTVYSAIISLAKASKTADKTLDEAAAAIARRAATLFK